MSLGKYRFEQGNQWFVMVATDGADGHVIADAVQFLPEDAVVETKKAARTKPVQAPAPMDLKGLEAELKITKAASALFEEVAARDPKGSTRLSDD